MRNSTRNMTLVALFAALTAVGAYLEIPTQPVPFTLQVLFCMYAGILLGGKLGFLSQVVYVLMGLIGLPVFAGGASGLGHVLKPTFGYLIGFIVCAFVIGKLTEKAGKIQGISGVLKIFSFSIVGLTIVYLIGVPYLYVIFKTNINPDITFNGALKLGLYPFIIQDLIKCILVAATSIKIIPAIRRAGFIPETVKHRV